MRRYFPDLQTLLEVGCGTGFVLQAIHAAFPRAQLIASDFMAEGLAIARQRVPTATFREEDVRALDLSNAVDVACAFDVLEHVPEDTRVLERLFAAVHPGGGLLLTVPQHPALWSPVDVQAHHVRRYRRRDLLDQVRHAGFEVVRVTSFISVLLPAMAVSRWLQRGGGQAVGTEGHEFRVSRGANALLTSLLSLERLGIRLGLSWPAGGSLLLVARKPTGTHGLGPVV